MPKPCLGDWPDRPGGRNRSTDQDNGPRAALAPGDQAGLVQFGAHPERLPPGSRSDEAVSAEIRSWFDTVFFR